MFLSVAYSVGTSLVTGLVGVSTMVVGLDTRIVSVGTSLVTRVVGVAIVVGLNIRIVSVGTGLDTTLVVSITTVIVE